MPFDPILAAIRFGTGLSPRVAPPGSARAMLERLRGPDEAAAAWPIPTYDSLRPRFEEFLATGRAVNEARKGGGEAPVEVQERLASLRREAHAERSAEFRATLARLACAEDGLRERLVLFWADHFTVRGKSGAWDRYITPYVEEAIRPRVAGRFGDLLFAVTTHPMMLKYLDQDRSVGPGSRGGQARGRGLNENLARELMELHTLGVDAPYRQRDVRQLAELLTGLTVNGVSMAYRPAWAEPGRETVLGRTYSAEADLGTIRAALDDLALHPATAGHIARKLAVHFVADEPDPDLVEAMRRAYGETGGRIGAVVQAMLAHPAAWAPEKRKVRQPIEFLAASLRALGVEGAWLLGRDEGQTDELFQTPLAEMGQAWQQPPGPNGWPEEAEAWITPQGLAARIDWAMTVPERILAELPDPRAFVEAALGPDLPREVSVAAHAAERRDEGVGLVLASAEFQRR
ncbi:hypothetical protein Rumeso_00781 [Rubellimicrobium mesophilum DSM 19309]|uniref:DUF1800 domain-containing protein n=1 Tax=Rubellimicrobium mesophilum DSM 19309 TaxID=442562 RepID=A0A017HTH4_9RHOB|nr:DUF1800 domain-containing protein [Rubellimicrobium mesophilum]EYD77615.1 hypothetical protein Rumeso_00781 [Rubellimicrobium mesophilum DSM 19309]